MDKIKIFIMDVDGTMTDGKIYMGAAGELIKAFDIKDGYGIHEILPAHGVTTVIMTGRMSQIVVNRARELEINYVLQNIKDKKEAIYDLSKKLGVSTAEMAYIGDDLIDKPAIKLCGISACPADAVNEVKSIVTYVCTKNGGDGAVREFIEWLLLEGYLGGEENQTYEG